jgi:sec-independent protein translocase protein TatA
MFGIGAQELMIIFLIVLLLFGANRIPEIARGLGRGIRDFKRATRDIEDDLNLRDEDPGRNYRRRDAASTAPHREASAAPERPVENAHSKENAS